MMKSLFALALMAVFLPVSPALAASDFVLIERSEPAYTVFAGIPADKEDEVRARLESAPEGVELVPWQTFDEGRGGYISAQIRENEYPDSRAVEGIVALVRKYPGTPFGLTWNGGIAFTFNDYQHTRKIYQEFVEDPEAYREQGYNRDPRGDPINPRNHLGPLLGW